MERTKTKNICNSPMRYKQYQKLKKLNLNVQDPLAPQFGKRNTTLQFRIIRVEEDPNLHKNPLTPGLKELLSSSSESEFSEHSFALSSQTVAGFRSLTKKMKEDEEFNTFLRKQEEKILSTNCITPLVKNSKSRKNRERFSSYNVIDNERKEISKFESRPVPQDEEEHRDLHLAHCISERNIPEVKVFEVQNTLTQLKRRYDNKSAC